MTSDSLGDEAVFFKRNMVLLPSFGHLRYIYGEMSNDPLHGITLERMLTELVDTYGWDDLAFRIKINCFSSNPSIKSSLKFLRKTPWARNKVEILYKQFLGIKAHERRI